MVQCKCFLYEFINLELYLEYKDPRFYLEILKILESGFIKGFQVQQWIGATMVLKKNCLWTIVLSSYIFYSSGKLYWSDTTGRAIRMSDYTGVGIDTFIDLTNHPLPPSYGTTLVNSMDSYPEG